MKREDWRFKATDAKSCPFCGSNSISVCHKEVRYIGVNGFGVKKLKMKAYCTCNKCHSRGKPIFYIGYANATLCSYNENYLPIYSCGDKAIDAWNRRAEV